MKDETGPGKRKRNDECRGPSRFDERAGSWSVFRITNGNSPLAAEGAPYVFESFEQQGLLPASGDGKLPLNSQADKRRRELPVDNAVVRFP